MRPRFDLLTLQLILAIDATGSVARAAESMHLTASAVSKRVLELEEQLGSALLERHPSGARLNQAGAVLARRAKAVLQELHSLQDDMADFISGTAGSVQIASNTSGLACDLADQLAQFTRRYPDIKVSVREATSQAVVQAVAEGWADFGIASTSVDLGALSAQPYRSTPLVLAVPSGHPLTGRGAVRYADILSYAHIGRAPDSALARLPAPPQTAHMRDAMLDSLVTSFPAVFSLVRAGAGVAVVPLSPTQSGVLHGIELLPLADDWAVFDLCLVRDPSVVPSPAAARLLKILTQQADINPA
jgi:DNA-binding transcriptional LysR family regulator